MPFHSPLFFHARDPDNIKSHHIQQQKAVVLVDSVINSGKTVIEFVQHIRKLSSSIRIMIVAGVAHAQSVEENLTKAFSAYDGITLVALRLSDNKDTGSGDTDTGHRLFNTTHLA